MHACSIDGLPPVLCEGWRIATGAEEHASMHLQLLKPTPCIERASDRASERPESNF